MIAEEDAFIPPLLQRSISWRRGSAGRIGVILERTSDGEILGLASLNPLLRPKVGKIAVGDTQAQWLRLSIADCPITAIRETCAFVAFDGGKPQRSALLSSEPLAGSPCPIGSALGTDVHIHGGSLALGRVIMAYQPVEFRRSDGRSVHLHDTLAVRFEEAEGLKLEAGALVVKTSTFEPLGLLIGGSPSFALLVPLEPLLSSGRFILAHISPPSADAIKSEANRLSATEKQSLPSTLLEVPEWVKAA